MFEETINVENCWRIIIRDVIIQLHRFFYSFISLLCECGPNMADKFLFEIRKQ